MAVSAFKSTSRRGTIGTSSNATSSSSSRDRNSEDLNKKVTHRRSRSVSALPRTSSSSSIVDFLNKRDNPLFCSTSSSPPDDGEPKILSNVSKFGQKVSKLDESPKRVEVNSDNRRGRSVLRNSDNGNRFGGASKGMGRSSSTVSTGQRRRSVSRGRDEISEKTASNGRPSKTATAGENRTKNLRTWSSQHPHSESYDVFSSCSRAIDWEDSISTSSFSEAEERTIKAVSEQMKSCNGDHPAQDAVAGGIYETVRSEVRRAISEIQNDLENVIQRKSPSIISMNNLVDIPPDLVNPDAIELVSEIRREYATKLQESQERARKLREDLAVEEQRGQELGKILEEILPEPKTVQSQKSRPRRKNSVERWKMSKRLADEAMNYFDECVSISTFDSSDFSSPEDQPVTSLREASAGISDGKCLPSATSSTSANYFANGHISHNKESDDQVQSVLVSQATDSVANSSTKVEPVKDENKIIDALSTRNLQFSFAREPTPPDSVHDNILTYIKKFEKEIKKDSMKSEVVRSSNYDEDDYELQVLDEKMLFDKVNFSTRIGSGGLLLCNSGIIF